MKRDTCGSLKWPFVITLLLVIAAVSLNTEASAAASGADTFKAKCAMCHGPDGAGNTRMGQRLKVRDLRSPEVQKQTDAELIAIITNGKPPMPAYGKSLSAADIHELIMYIRSIGKS